MSLRIVCFSSDRELALLRKRVMESAGYQVAAPATETDALAVASESNRFDVAIMCYRIWTGTPRKLMRLFRKANPASKFVIMVRVYGEIPDLEGDRYVVGADGPDALLTVLKEYATGPELSHSAQ